MGGFTHHLNQHASLSKEVPTESETTRITITLSHITVETMKTHIQNEHASMKVATTSVRHLDLAPRPFSFTVRTPSVNHNFWGMNITQKRSSWAGSRGTPKSTRITTKNQHHTVRTPSVNHTVWGTTVRIPSVNHKPKKYEFLL